MKLAIYILLLICVSFSSKEHLQKEELQSTLEPGRGYSLDTQQISQVICYKMSISSKSNAQSTIKLNQGSSFH